MKCYKLIAQQYTNMMWLTCPQVKCTILVDRLATSYFYTVQELICILYNANYIIDMITNNLPCIILCNTTKGVVNEFASLM